MKRRRRVLDLLVAALSLSMAVGFCALAVLLFFRAESFSVPAVESAGGAGTAEAC